MSKFTAECESIAGGSTILFHFEDDVATAEIAGAKLRSEASDGGCQRVRIVDTVHPFVLADIVIRPRDGMTMTDNLLAIGSALLWSHERWRNAGGDQRSSTPTAITADPVPALFFDEQGRGPNETALEIRTVRGEPSFKPPIQDAMGLGVVPLRGPGEFSMIFNVTLGGFLLDRESAAQLHARIGAWLAAHPASEG